MYAKKILCVFAVLVAVSRLTFAAGGDGKSDQTVAVYKLGPADADTVAKSLEESLRSGQLEARQGDSASTAKDAGPKSSRAASANNLKQLAVAMQMYHDKYKRLPPSVLYGPDGKTPYSWRIALLEFLEQSEAHYRQYRFDEPWDGPNNRRLAENRWLASLFQCPSEAASCNASYFALAGPGTVFEKKMGISLAEVRDGTSNTIMIVEAKRNIPWSKPEDIPYDPKKPIPELGGLFDEGFHVAFCDGTVRLLPKNMDVDILRALISRNGGETITLPR